MNDPDHLEDIQRGEMIRSDERNYGVAARSLDFLIRVLVNSAHPMNPGIMAISDQQIALGPDDQAVSLYLRSRFQAHRDNLERPNNT